MNPISKQKHRSVRLPPQLESKVDEALERTGLSLSHLIRQALLEKFERDSNPTQSVKPMVKQAKVDVSIKEHLMDRDLGWLIDGVFVSKHDFLSGPNGPASHAPGANWVFRLVGAWEMLSPQTRFEKRGVSANVTPPTDYLCDAFHLEGETVSRHAILSDTGPCAQIARQILSRCSF